MSRLLLATTQPASLPTTRLPFAVAMSLYALTYMNIEEGSLHYFPMRVAGAVAEYIVALVAGGQGDHDEFLWNRFLTEVVLRHVHGVMPHTVSVVGYDVASDCVTLADSNPLRLPMPTEARRGSWTKRMLDSVRKEEITADRYVVPVAKIMSNLANADQGNRLWGMIHSDVHPPCPCLQAVHAIPVQAVPAVPAVPVGVQAPVTIDLTPVTVDLTGDEDDVVPVQGPAKKRRSGLAASAAASASEDESDE